MFFPGLLNQIPLATLAAILIVTGFKLAGVPLFKQMWKEGQESVCSVRDHNYCDCPDGSAYWYFDRHDRSDFLYSSSNLKRPVRRIMEKHVGGDVLRIELANQVSFLNKLL
jgi:hypothetical protein